MLKVAQAAFAVATFWLLSDIHECSGGIKMAPSCLDKQTGACNLATTSLVDEFGHGFSYIVWYVEVKMASIAIFHGYSPTLEEC